MNDQWRTPNILVKHPLLLAQIVPGLLMIHVSLRVFGFGRTLNFLASFSRAATSGSSPDSGHTRQAETVGRLVNAAAVRLRMSCLDRSLMLWWLLRRQGTHATLLLGAPYEKREQFEAHAWVECNGAVVNDTPQVRDRYASLTSYENL